jgi:vacuolar-type H+-ATPase subunit I/STV1
MDPDLNKKQNIKDFIPKKTNDLMPDKPFKQQKSKLPVILTAVILILMISLAISVKPAITGYVVANNFEDTNMNVSDFIEEQELVKSELSLTKTSLDACKNINQDYLDDIEEQTSKTFQIEQEKNKIQSEFNQLKTECDFNKERLEKEFEQKKNQIDIEKQQLEIRYNEIKTIYDAVIENTATNIYCKAKVDNKNIDSYLISNSMIVCTTGGENKITC